MHVGQLTRSLARQATAFDRSKLDGLTGVRCALAIAIPLVIGLATGHPDGGAYVAAGALLTAFAYFQPGYRRRAAIMITVAVWLAATTLVGGLVGGWTWVVVLLAGLSACGAGLLVALGPNTTMVATLGTAAFVIASNQPVGSSRGRPPRCCTGRRRKPG